MKSLVSALSLIAALASGIALVACQFVAGINDEEKGTTTSTGSSTSSSSTGAGSTCPDPDGTQSVFGCTGNCITYCDTYLAECQGISYVSQPECCAICNSFSGTGQNGNTSACRNKALKSEDPSRCLFAGPFSNNAGPAPSWCGVSIDDFISSFHYVCGALVLSQAANPDAFGKTLLLAGQAKYWNCPDAASCLCNNLVQGTPDADGACETDCIKACEAL